MLVVEAVNIDLNAFHDEFYRELCGASLELVLDTLLYVYHQTHAWLEITHY